MFYGSDKLGFRIRIAEYLSIEGFQHFNVSAFQQARILVFERFISEEFNYLPWHIPI